jgi:uncharacterized protein
MAMHIGTLQVTVLLGEGSSLKDKRHVIKSLVATLRRRFNVSVAEVDDLNAWRRSTIGIACVSNDPRHVNRVLDSVLDHMESIPEIDVGAVELEID